jgi:hypothetical protein
MIVDTRALGRGLPRNLLRAARPDAQSVRRPPRRSVAVRDTDRLRGGASQRNAGLWSLLRAEAPRALLGCAFADLCQASGDLRSVIREQDHAAELRATGRRRAATTGRAVLDAEAPPAGAVLGGGQGRRPRLHCLWSGTRPTPTGDHRDNQHSPHRASIADRACGWRAAAKGAQP